MRRTERFPSLTPLRALSLLRRLEAMGLNLDRYLLDQLREALGNHVAHALVKARRRRKGRRS